MVPLVRMHAFEARLKRMLKTLDTEGVFDPQTGLLTRESFLREFERAAAEAADRSQALSLARFTFDGPVDERAGKDGARALTRLTRTIDFACRAEDGSILVAFTQTDLRSAHVVVRRLAGALKASMQPAAAEDIHANVTLATLKAGDTIDSVIMRVIGSQAVAAE
jgi:PleD family two-component response regulator